MIFPETCYRPTDLDLAGTLLDFVRKFGTTFSAAAAQQIPALYEVPKGKILVVNSLICYANPGAAQTCQTIEARVLTNGQYIDIGCASPNPSIAADVPSVHKLIERDLWLVEGSVIDISAAFNAGAAVNLIAVYLYGALVPRGAVAI
jgi:hypothetical protein